MRSIAMILVLSCGVAHAGAFDFNEVNSAVATHRKHQGAALLGTGLALVGVGLASSLSAIRSDHYDGYGVITGPVVGGVGAILTAVGAPLYGVGAADEHGPPGVATLKRRRSNGYALIALGLAMQVT